MRTTVTLDDDVDPRVQALQPSAKPSKKGGSRFPVFEVPAGARMIPAARIQKALAEDRS